MQEHGKSGQRAFCGRRRCKRRKCRPEQFLDRRVDNNAFACQYGGEPFCGPGAFGRLVDLRKWLEGNDIAVIMKRAAKVVPVAAHSDRCRSYGAAKVESEYLCALIAAELHCHKCEQHGFTGPGRANDEAMADVACMKGKAERGRSFGLAVKQGRVTEMIVPFRSRPHCGEGDQVGEIESGDGRLSDIGINMAGQASEPRLYSVHAFDHACKVPALDDLFGHTQLFRSDRRICVPYRQRCCHIGNAGMVGAQLLQCHVCVDRLVGCVVIHEDRWFVGHHFLEDGGQGFALGKPLAAYPAE